MRGSLLSKGPFCSWLPVLQGRLSVPLFPSCAVGDWISCFLRTLVGLFCDGGHSGRSEGLANEAGKVMGSLLHRLSARQVALSLAVRGSGSH